MPESRELFPAPTADVNFKITKFPSIHEWRNYVGERTQAIWPSLSQEAREAIAQDAQDRASSEEWD